jgi:hypothetical protein
LCLAAAIFTPLAVLAVLPGPVQANPPGPATVQDDPKCQGSATLLDFFWTTVSETDTTPTQLNADFNLKCNGFSEPTGCTLHAHAEAWYSTSGGEVKIADINNFEYLMECGDERRVQIDVPGFYQGPGHYRLKITWTSSNVVAPQVFEDTYDF